MSVETSRKSTLSMPRRKGPPGIDGAVRREYQFVGPIVRLGKKKRFVVATALDGPLEQVVKPSQSLASGVLTLGPSSSLGRSEKRARNAL